MKITISIILFLSFWNCFSQTNYLDAPKEYKKIHFVYQQKTNYYIDEKGVFADTLLFQVDFPELKYAKVVSPNDSLFIYGFVSIKDLKRQDKKRLSSILYHNNQKFEGEFSVAKNTTIIKVERNDELTRAIFKKHLKSGYSTFRYTITIDYNKKTIFTDYPMAAYLLEFKSESKQILYDASKLSGVFKAENGDFIFENKVVLNDKLSNKIVTGQVFTNNFFGVEKITSVRDRYELISVSYK